MNKIIGWVLGFTKIGKVIEPVQKLLSGWKVHLAGAALWVPALLTILDGVANSGMQYLVNVVGTPEWGRLMEGIAFSAGRAAITKGFNKQKDPNYPNQDQ